MTDEKMGVGPQIDRTPDAVVFSTAQEHYVSWAVDLLIYTVVLNLFVEYVDGVVIDSFTISILTAVLLKIMLVLLGRVEHRVHHHFAAKGTTSAKVIGVITIFLILFGGKLLILEVVNLVFGDHVELGHFVEVLLLIVAMMATRQIANLIFKRLGVRDEPKPATHAS